MKDHNLETVLRPWDELKPHPENPKNGDVEAIAESLRVNGQYRPIVTTTDGTILAGNHTYMAAGEIGMKEMACVVIDVDAYSAEARRILIADNRTSDLGSYDDGVLIQLLAQMSDDTQGLIGTGYDDRDLQRLLQKQDGYEQRWGDRDTLPMPEGVRAKKGDRWKLGDHTLVCGDSGDPDVWVGAPYFDAWITDPPYGIGYTGSTLIREAIKDDHSAAASTAAIEAAFRNVSLKPGAVAYTFGPTGLESVDIGLCLRDLGIMRWSLVWVKDAPTFSRNDYHIQHEYIWYGWIEGAHLKVTDRTRTTIIECDRPKTSKDHPTQKPVALLDELISSHEWPHGAVIVDPFAGTGTIMASALNYDISTWMVEGEPGYCDVIIARYEQLTGREAELLTRATA